MKLKNKIAIVTGSRRGIGQSIALELAKEGAKVVISDIDLKECQNVCDEIKKIGSDAIAVKCDVSKKRDVDAMVKKTIQKFKRIDILVNNAGVVLMKPFVQMIEKDWDFVLGINLKGVFLCTNAAAKQMVKQKGGKIISIASIAGEVGFMNTSAYCASKAGIINLTRELAMELSPHNINVNVVAPGVIATKMTEDMLKDKKTKEVLLANTPLGRVGQPEEIGKAVVFLASDDSSFITGHTLVVDGGWLTH
ncbi:3-oxoacyl-ACP reductase FabG [Patescibacteria group bacterium]|nr:3-oxoacyl-ACP reductase FabG [Patescibacteria group bacterium]